MRRDHDLDLMPSGPLSGATLTLYRSKSGTTLHGTRACPTLRKSSPASVEHDLGVAETIGKLRWPVVHCAVEFADPSLTAYIEQAMLVGRWVAETDAAQADWDEGGVASSERAMERQRPWRWHDLAPAIAPFAAMPGLALRIEVAPPELAARFKQAGERRETLAGQVRQECLAPPWGLRGKHTDLAIQTLAQACAARRVLDSYEPRDRDEYSAWSRFVTAGSAGVEAVLDPPTVAASRRQQSIERPRLCAVSPHRAEQPDGASDKGTAKLRGELFDTEYIARARALSDRDESRILAALNSGGQASWAYYRLQHFLQDPDQPWTDALLAWLDGASYSSWPHEPYDRIRLARADPATTMPAWAAAEAGFTSYIHGLVDGARQLNLVAIPARSLGDLICDWVSAGVVLAFPHFYAVAPRRTKTTPLVEALRLGEIDTGPGLLVGCAPTWATWAFRRDRAVVIAEEILRQPREEELQRIAQMLTKAITADGSYSAGKDALRRDVLDLL